MSSKNWKFKYGGAAVIAALLIIAVAFVANPGILPQQAYAQSSLAILLTDPPTVPAGTTQLNMTYTDVAIHVSYPNGTTEWLPINASGTVNLFSLVNVTQTIGTTKVPTNSTVDKVQFTIANVTAVINSQDYNVTSLSNAFVVKVSNTVVNQTLSGLLVDFNPTLVQIQASDVNGTTVYYYVLVPSASATVVSSINEEHVKVGTIVKLGEDNRVKLVKVKQEFEKNVTIVSASLAVNGNATSLAVDLKNNGDIAFKIFGLTLHGEFNATRTQTIAQGDHDDEDGHRARVEQVHPETIPFKLNGTSLIPLFGNGDREDEHGDHELSSFTIQPGGTVTLNFTGVISLQTEGHHFEKPAIVITPLTDANYTIRLMGEGFQTFIVQTAP